jgi:hypothetical protein
MKLGVRRVGRKLPLRECRREECLTGMKRRLFRPPATPVAQFWKLSKIECSHYHKHHPYIRIPGKSIIGHLSFPELLNCYRSPLLFSFKVATLGLTSLFYGFHRFMAQFTQSRGALSTLLPRKVSLDTS